jgi:hypothetical protein
MGFAAQNPCGQGLRPRHPGGIKAKIGPTALGVCYPSLRTPSQRPPAFGGRRKKQTSRIALRAGCPSLHTPSGVLPAFGRQPW